ncbi:LolA family protein [Rufibacter latericius]|uniref:Outer membrane lipoprotein carrier protein LolA n=1 Tax=Rufibacter latericius TaxID=2487040 RepID=A0A3M9N0H0_9BACT|nr:outer membrane lipoprotein carrier protein LolA [Rufibacter latericius]RNI31294.1 outer membrane lipoprotein carrier protein LolA [Rufibacter latericius]
MKRYFSFLLALLTVVQLAQAQNVQKDPQAEKVLDAMSKKYQAMNAFKVGFTQTVESPSAKAKESINGDITVSGNKYRLMVAGQEIINNGATIWTIMKKEGEVTIADNDPDEQEMTPNQIYNLYKKGYRYVYAGEEKEGGEAVHVVDLTPEDRENQIFKVRLHISKKDNSLKSWKMFRKNGNRYTYKINKFTPNPPVDANTFVFNRTKYKGLKVVDLR